jgi:KDO2-lipid IV(A) lauroyltransferase
LTEVDDPWTCASERRGLLLAALTGMARTVPLDVGYRLAELLSDGHRVLHPGRRRAVEGNLRVLVGDRDVKGLVGEVFRNYGRFLFEFIRGPELPELDYVLENREVLDRARARGRGVVLAVVHTGNWEIGGARLAASGVRVHAVAGTQLREAWTDELRRRQERIGVRILPPTGTAFREMPRILARNEVVALLIDGNLFRRGIPVPLCGHEVELPAGPARLAARTGAALVPAFSVRSPHGLRARFLDEVPVRDARPEAIRRATTELADRLGERLVEHPEQWMIFRRVIEARGS